MDGTGVSGLTLDFTKTQILIMDFEWLGVGRVRYGFIIDGFIYYVHQMLHANVLDLVYMSTPNLPIRGEITCTGTAVADTLDMLCASVISEGGQDFSFVTRHADRGITTISIDNTLTPLISMRLKSTDIRASVIPDGINILTTSGANFRWQLVVNPTITGGSAASWVAVTNSAIEYDVTQNGAVSGGTVIAGGYGSADLNSVVEALRVYSSIGATISGTSDIITLAVQKTAIGAGTEAFLGGLSWREFQ